MFNIRMPNSIEFKTMVLYSLEYTLTGFCHKEGIFQCEHFRSIMFYKESE